MPTSEIPSTPFEIIRPLDFKAMSMPAVTAYSRAADRLSAEGEAAGMRVIMRDLDAVRISLMGIGSLRYALKNTAAPNLSLATIRRELALTLPDSFPNAESALVETVFARNIPEPTDEVACNFGIVVSSHTILTELQTVMRELCRQTNVKAGARNRLTVKLGHSPDPLPTAEHSLRFRRALRPLLNVTLPFAKIDFNNVEESL